MDMSLWPGTINTKSRRRLNYGWDIYTDRSPRAPSFVVAAEKWNGAKERETDAEETGGSDLRMKRNREVVVTQIEPKSASK